MKKLRIYLDTSIINFIFADDAPDKRDRTLEFFEKFVKAGIYDVYISSVVITEIEETPDVEQRERLLKAITASNLRMLDNRQMQEEISLLVEAYFKSGVVPRIKVEDAFHIATATVHEFDILLSWNFRHMSNVHRELRVNAVNAQMGYNKPLRMLTPLGVINDEE